MYENILLPTDGTSATATALDHALTVAVDKDATVHPLYIVDKRLLRAADSEATEEIRQSLEEEATSALDDARAPIENEGVRVETAQREGTPHRAILDYAEEADIDLIVMGTHSKNGRERLAQLGSTTERVVKNADLPVLVVEIGD